MNKNLLNRNRVTFIKYKLNKSVNCSNYICSILNGLQICELLSIYLTIENVQVKNAIKFLMVSFTESTWNTVSRMKNLPTTFLYEFRKVLDWNIVSRHHVFKLNELSIFKKYINWTTLIKTQNLKNRHLEFILKLKVPLILITKYQNISKQIIFDILERDHSLWYAAVKYQTLDDELIKTIYQLYISSLPSPKSQQLFFFALSKYQTLSHNIMHTFKDSLIWDSIIKYQKLDNVEIVQFFEYLDLDLLFNFQVVSPDLLELLDNKFNYIDKMFITLI